MFIIYASLSQLEYHQINKAKLLKKIIMTRLKTMKSNSNGALSSSRTGFHTENRQAVCPQYLAKPPDNCVKWCIDVQNVLSTRHKLGNTRSFQNLHKDWLLLKIIHIQRFNSKFSSKSDCLHCFYTVGWTSGREPESLNKTQIQLINTSLYCPTHRQLLALPVITAACQWLNLTCKVWLALSVCSIVTLNLGGNSWRIISC